MRRLSLVFVLLGFSFLGLNCQTTYSVAPIPAGSFTATFTSTHTPCGYPGNTCTPTFTWTPTSTFTATNSPTKTFSPTVTHTPTNTFTPPFTYTPTPTNPPTVSVSTFAGSGAQGNANGTGTSATFHWPWGIAIDNAGNLYVSESDDIRKITPGGVVSTLAGSGTSGSANGTGTAASFFEPMGLAVDGSGNVYVADYGNNLIRLITPGGVVSTFAGSGAAGAANGTGTAASFNGPAGVALDSSGNVYVADRDNNLIRKITPGGVVSTFAGSGNSGYVNGTGTAAWFSFPSDLRVDSSGNVWVADSNTERIRFITPGAVVSSFAGSGGTGFTNGSATVATFNGLNDIALDSSGNIYVADNNNYVVRKVTPGGVVSTYAGSGLSGSANGAGTAASFNAPAGVVVDGAGNLYVTDMFNNMVRKIAP